MVRIPPSANFFLSSPKPTNAEFTILKKNEKYWKYFLTDVMRIYVMRNFFSKVFVFFQKGHFFFN